MHYCPSQYWYSYFHIHMPIFWVINNQYVYNPNPVSKQSLKIVDFQKLILDFWLWLKNLKKYWNREYYMFSLLNRKKYLSVLDPKKSLVFPYLCFWWLNIFIFFSREKWQFFRDTWIMNFCTVALLHATMCMREWHTTTTLVHASWRDYFPVEDSLGLPSPTTHTSSS